MRRQWSLVLYAADFPEGKRLSSGITSVWVMDALEKICLVEKHRGTALLESIY